MTVTKFKLSQNDLFLGPLAFLAVFCAAICAFSCASTPTAPPPWAASPNGIRQVFPDAAYIAQEGRGQTRQAAEADGAAQIARFLGGIQHEV